MMVYMCVCVCKLKCLCACDMLCCSHVHVPVCSLCSGLVPLHNACSYGHFDVTELLLKVCACVCVCMCVCSCLNTVVSWSIAFHDVHVTARSVSVGCL